MIKARKFESGSGWRQVSATPQALNLAKAKGRFIINIRTINTTRL